MRKGVFFVILLIFLSTNILALNFENREYGLENEVIVSTGGGTGNTTNYYNVTNNNNTIINYNSNMNATQFIDNSTIDESWLGSFITAIFNSLFGVKTTDDLPQGSTNFYWLNTTRSIQELLNSTGIYNQSSSSSFNTTYDNYALNVSRNYTLNTWNNFNATWDNSWVNVFAYNHSSVFNLQQALNGTGIYSQSFNTTYNNYATNVSLNYSALVFNGYNATWSNNWVNQWAYNHSSVLNLQNVLNTTYIARGASGQNQTLISCKNITIDGSDTDFCTDATGGSSSPFLNDSTWAYLGGAGASLLGLNVSNNLFVNSTNVGIGTTSPSQKLEVNGNANITGNLTVGGNLTQGYGIIYNFTNVNGTCIRFAEGTQQCYGNLTVATCNNVVSAPVYYGSTPLTFPLTFSSIPFVTTGVIQGPTGGIPWPGMSQTVTTQSATIYGMCAISGTGYYPSYNAIGRWK